MSISKADNAMISAAIQGSLVNVESGIAKETTGKLTGSFESE
jgi:hypothetical protein